MGAGCTGRQIDLATRVLISNPDLGWQARWSTAVDNASLSDSAQHAGIRSLPHVGGEMLEPPPPNPRLFVEAPTARWHSWAVLPEIRQPVKRIHSEVDFTEGTGKARHVKACRSSARRRTRMFLTVLHQLPDLAILVTVVLLVTALSVVAPIVSHRFLGLSQDQERHDAALDGYKAIMGMIGVVLPSRWCKPTQTSKVFRPWSAKRRRHLRRWIACCFDQEMST